MFTICEFAPNKKIVIRAKQLFRGALCRHKMGFGSIRISHHRNSIIEIDLQYLSLQCASSRASLNPSAEILDFIHSSAYSFSFGNHKIAGCLRNLISRWVYRPKLNKNANDAIKRWRTERMTYKCAYTIHAHQIQNVSVATLPTSMSVLEWTLH